MPKRIEIVGAKAKRIKNKSQSRRHIDSTELAAALGANLADRQVAGNLDPIALADLGTQLLSRLRSSGGRPALTDANEFCRVPLSAEDVKNLEDIVAQIEWSTGTKPSVGQVVGVIVRKYLTELSTRPLSSIGLVATIDRMEMPICTSGVSFPSVSNFENVTACARDLARRQMPLMIADAAA